MDCAKLKSNEIFRLCQMLNKQEAERKFQAMEKYPENVMKAMAYFEFFYMDQLKKKNK